MIRGKHSCCCIGCAQSIQFAVAKQTKAVGRLYVRPALTITHLFNLPVEADFGYHVGSLLQKYGSLSNRTNKSGRMSYHLGWLSVMVCALVYSRAPFSDRPMSLQPRVEHQTVSEWWQQRGSFLGRAAVGELCLAPATERSIETLLVIIKECT
jgi:hypothetical protein